MSYVTHDNYKPTIYIVARRIEISDTAYSMSWKTKCIDVVLPI